MNNLNHSRMLVAWLFAAGILLAIAGSGLADVRYVNVNSTSPTSPYTNWTTAATTIQDAVDAAVDSDQILVTNGVYQTGERGVSESPNRVAVTTAIMARSVNGAAVTVIHGQEWRAGTNPTDALSTLRLFSPTFATPGVIVNWQSVSGRIYFPERGTDLSAQPPFHPLATDIIGQPGTTTFTDTMAVGAGPFFYRVGVEE